MDVPSRNTIVSQTQVRHLTKILNSDSQRKEKKEKINIRKTKNKKINDNKIRRKKCKKEKKRKRGRMTYQ